MSPGNCNKENFEGSEAWEEFAKNYDQKVLSLTKFEVRRKQILGQISPGRVLNLGVWTD